MDGVVTGNQGSQNASAGIQPTAEPNLQLQQNEPQHNAAGVQSSDDILLRATKLSQESSPNAGDKFSSQEFDKMIEGIQDPALKEQVSLLRKSLLSGFNKKFEEVAHLKKELEQRLSNTQNSWTPERVRALASNPEFIAAAQRAGLSDSNTTAEPAINADDLEYDNPALQKALKTIDTLNQKVAALERNTQQAIQMQTQTARESQHQILKQKYANYNPEEIDTITAEMLENKIQVTPEHIYWAFKGKENAEKMYKLGLKDAAEGINNKMQLSSVDANSGVSSSGNTNIEPNKDESYSSYSQRVIKNILSSIRNKNV